MKYSKKVSITVEHELYNEFINRYSISGIVNKVLHDMQYSEKYGISPPEYLGELLRRCKK